MKISNFALELAEARSEQERETAIASASKAIGRVGRGPCVDCRRDISAKRRYAAPFTRRCIVCQTQHEEWGR